MRGRGAFLIFNKGRGRGAFLIFNKESGVQMSNKKGWASNLFLGVFTRPLGRFTRPPVREYVY